MTERGQPIDVALACPFVAFEDERDERAEQPDPRHRCYAENPPTPLSRTHQEAYCLSPTFAGCPIFREWARREAARVQQGAPRAAEPPPRIRDEEAERQAALGWAAGVAGQEPAEPPRRPTFGQPPPPAPEQRAGDERRGVPDLPPRPVHQGPWSQPPPWLANRGGGPPSSGPAGTESPPLGPGPDGPSPSQDALNEGLDRLVTRRDEPWRVYPPEGPSTPGAPPSFLNRPPDERPPLRPNDPSQGLAGSIADESAAALSSRLAALGMAEPEASRAVPMPPPMTAEDRRYQDPGRIGMATGSESPPVRRVPLEDEVIGAAAMREPPRSSGALSQILRWNRPPAVSETRGRQKVQDVPPPRRVQQPPWERPQRYEAYPTIRRRMGLPGIPRVLLGAIALAVAAALLFFVPPMFIGGPGGPGDEASPTPSASSASARPSSSPTRAPGPTPRVYVVRAGDTLSRIATRFGVTVDQILAANPDIKNPNQIAIGDKINIPSPEPSELVEPSEDPDASEEPEATE